MFYSSVNTSPCFILPDHKMSREIAWKFTCKIIKILLCPRSKVCRNLPAENSVRCIHNTPDEQWEHYTDMKKICKRFSLISRPSLLVRPECLGACPGVVYFSIIKAEPAGAFNRIGVTLEALFGQHSLLFQVTTGKSYKQRYRHYKHTQYHWLIVSLRGRPQSVRLPRMKQWLFYRCLFR